MTDLFAYMAKNPQEPLGWLATCVFALSYAFKVEKSLLRTQFVAAGMWAAYGAMIHSAPMIAANLIVVGAAAYKLMRLARATA